MGARRNTSHQVAEVLAKLPATVSTAQHLLGREALHRGRRVAPDLEALFPRGGLEPGALYECRGYGALSFACAVVASSTKDNAWTCFFNLSSLNMQAVSDLGVALHRVASTQCSARATTSQQSQVLGAVVEGFDFVIARSPQCTPSAARTIAARAQRNGTTVLLLGQHGFRADVVVTANVNDWTFSDRLVSRRVHISLHDQHNHHRRDIHVQLPDSRGGVSGCVAQ
jgi:hypothetical protein